MSIGDKFINPMTTREFKGTGELVAIVHSGLTYREWLIGMLASNSRMFDDASGNPLENPTSISKNILQQANIIIKQLDKGEGK